MDPEKKITVVRDGPYLVGGGIPLAEELIACDELGTPTHWEPGIKYPQQESYSLCRCGKSGDKPFCDGTHAEAGFRDETQAPGDDYFAAADVVEGPAIDLYDVPRLCARIGFCHRGGNIWKMAATGTDVDTVALVIDDACDCASGRLLAAHKDSGEAVERDLEPSISIIQVPAGKASGPLWIKGGIPIESIDGFLYEVRNRVTLCRCGASDNMPFCDATHAHIAFSDGSGSIR